MRSQQTVPTALLFAVCGMASSQLLNIENWGTHLLPVPFGLLSAWLLVDAAGPAIVLVVLDAAVWQIAFRVAADLGAQSGTGRRVFALFLAGLVGGLGVTLATALAQRRRPSLTAIATGSVLGGLGGLPFAAWVVLGLRSPIPEWLMLILCFAIWQGLAGASLWVSFQTQPRSKSAASG